MSADNGVYILKTPARDYHGSEYRVAEHQNIENILWGEVHEQEQWLKSYFASCKVWREADSAWLAAARLYERIRQAGRVIEYGVSVIELERPFPVGKRRARRNRGFTAGR